MRWKRGTLIAAVAGFVLGAAAGAGYLLLGGGYFLSIPTWAWVCFFPGFEAGNYAFAHGLGEAGSKVMGVLAVAVVYAALFALARVLWTALRPRSTNPTADGGGGCEP
jgi:hypothetical protein